MAPRVKRLQLDNRTMEKEARAHSKRVSAQLPCVLCTYKAGTTKHINMTTVLFNFTSTARQLSRVGCLCLTGLFRVKASIVGLLLGEVRFL